MATKRLARSDTISVVIKNQSYNNNNTNINNSNNNNAKNNSIRSSLQLVISHSANRIPNPHGEEKGINISERMEDKFPSDDEDEEDQVKRKRKK